MVKLIYCAGGNKRFADIAVRHGLAYGAQLPATVYHAPYFADQDWKKPNRDKYMKALEKHRPYMATVLDWEREDQYAEVISWAWEASRYVSEVLIIPKVIGSISRIPVKVGGKPVRLAYSVPTMFGGTSVPVWEFERRPVHLLGGSPHEQMKHAQYMNVVSADGNYIQAMAVKRNQFFSPGSAVYGNNRHFPKLNESVLGHIDKDAPYVAFELSCINMKAAWLGCAATIRYAVESDLQAIKTIANQYKSELGYVMLPALRESIQRNTLLVAEYGGYIVGFVNYRARKDGGQTIYEIAVRKDFRGQNIGAGLLAAVPHPVRLKCTVDNERGNAFYAAAGMTLIRREQGKRRELNVWETTQR